MLHETTHKLNQSACASIGFRGLRGLCVHAQKCWDCLQRARIVNSGRIGIRDRASRAGCWLVARAWTASVWNTQSLCMRAAAPCLRMSRMRSTMCCTVRCTAHCAMRSPEGESYHTCVLLAR
eukprot:365918-Chlamydomonas_euryale.AAC.1